MNLESVTQKWSNSGRKKQISSINTYIWASLVAQMVKNLPAMPETWVQSLGQEDALGTEMVILSSFLAGASHGQRSLVGHSPWGHRELDMTEWLTYSWLIHVVVWQKLTQHCRAGIPQPKKRRRLGKVPAGQTWGCPRGGPWGIPRLRRFYVKLRTLCLCGLTQQSCSFFGSRRKNYGLWSLSCTAPTSALHWPTVDQ